MADAAPCPSCRNPKTTVNTKAKPYCTKKQAERVRRATPEEIAQA